MRVKYFCVEMLDGGDDWAGGGTSLVWWTLSLSPVTIFWSTLTQPDLLEHGHPGILPLHCPVFYIYVFYQVNIVIHSPYMLITVFMQDILNVASILPNLNEELSKLLSLQKYSYLIYLLPKIAFLLIIVKSLFEVLLRDIHISCKWLYNS